MTQNKPLLVGKWKFIGAEKHDGDDWHPATFINGMTWEFHPQFFSDTKTLGNIIEDSPRGEQTTLNYLFNTTDNCLRIEVYTDPQSKILDETDIYELLEVKQTDTQTTITLSLISQLGYPPPYLRYTLQQIA